VNEKKADAEKAKV
jgi:dynein heavy chain 1, cytosolic